MSRLVVRAAIGVAVVVGAALVSIFSGILPIGGRGDGDGSESGKPAESAADSADPSSAAAQPDVSLDGQLVVTIDDRRLLVDGKEKTPDEIAQLASRVPDEFSVKVRVILKNTSRADAENELARTLDSQGISYEMKDE